MKTHIAAASVAFLALTVSARADEGPVTCEDLSQQVTDTMRTTALTDAVKAKVTALLENGRQECSIEEDDQAAADLKAALAMMGK
jgi:hypothetical protein